MNPDFCVTPKLNVISEDSYDPADESQRVHQNLLYRIRASQIKTYPFSHFYGESVFDSLTSRRIREFWPSNDLFVSIANTSRVSAGRYEQRNMLPINTLIQRLPTNSPSSRFWSTFNSAVGGDEFLCEVLEWLWPEIKKVRELPEKISIYSELVLTEDSVGYSIGPHTDAPSRLITMLFYVPEGSDSADAGTSIYVPKRPDDYKTISAVHRDPDDFNEVFCVPFLRDAFVGFVVGPRSFHGVAPVSVLKTPRRQIQYTIRFTDKQTITS